MDDMVNPADSAEHPVADAETAEVISAPPAVEEQVGAAGLKERSGAFLGVPIEVTISVGKAHPQVSELVELRRDSVLPLDSSINDPVELYIGDKLIARGELQELGDNTGRLGVRLTEVADFSNDK